MASIMETKFWGLNEGFNFKSLPVARIDNEVKGAAQQLRSDNNHSINNDLNIILTIVLVFMVTFTTFRPLYSFM